MTVNYLQSKEMGTAKAVELIAALKGRIKERILVRRSMDSFVQLIKMQDIVPPIELHRRRCREDSNQRIWTKDDYKVKLSDTVIGEFVKELVICSDDEASCILKAMTAMNPHCQSFF